MTKGLKTSELWVVLLLLLPHVAQMFGLNISTEGLEEIPQHISDLAQAIQAQTGDTGSGTTWLAAIYVIGRQALKWKEVANADTQKG